MLTLLLALIQAPAQTPIARVEVTPATPEVTVGQTLQLSARALDGAGQVVSGARIQWFGDGEGNVDSMGVVTGGYQGYIQVTAAASVAGMPRPVFGFARVRVLPGGPVRVAVPALAGPLLVGSRLTLSATAYSAENDRRDDPVTWTSSNSRVAQVTADGRLRAVAPGRATLTGRAGTASAALAVQVIPAALSRLEVEPGSSQARTGDVIRFRATGRSATGRDVSGFAVRWSVAGGEGVATIDDAGAFVAERPGRYTVTATAGNFTADAVVTVSLRRVTRGMEVLGRVPLQFRGAEIWVHPSGTCAYMSTIADRVYVINVENPRAPKIVDSMMVDAQIVNDIMTTEDGKYGVFSREGASNRRNGLKIFEASDPCHPKVIADYTETVTGGVHSSYVYQGHAYITDDATGSMRVIDIRDPYKPKEVARWQTEQTEVGRYVHDIAVQDGLAYLSYWNDGLIILDVGNGIKGGSPAKPVFVSQFKYDLNEEYARIDQLYGLGARGTHTAWRAGKYVFVGDEVYAARAARGLEDGNDLTWGKLHVIDVSDIAHPKKVAWYEPTDGGVHNVWVEGDTLYLGNYHGGARVLDISGELKGDLLRQGREISWIWTADSMGARARSPFAWGVVVKQGIMYVPDINTGLWIMRVEPKQEQFTP
ncbi:MAG: Ig-like domain-containing protein [Gemmatimonadota bacterium]|nr:Ig-like domain-containing protein [Gemmatimonadota bacterium]